MSKQYLCKKCAHTAQRPIDIPGIMINCQNCYHVPAIGLYEYLNGNYEPAYVFHVNESLPIK